MVYTDMLVGGIIALVIGIILYYIKGQLPAGGATAANIGAIILTIVGIILIVLSVLLPYI